MPTRHDAPCDFFIVVGLENGKAVQARQEQDQQDQQRVRSTTSQDNVHQYHFDTTSMDLLLSEQRELSPTILDRYPPQDYTNATVDPMVPVFCMPLGIAPLDPLDTATFTASASPPNVDDNNNPVDQAKPSTTTRQSLPAPTIHQFTLTTGDGSKVYGVCLTFYEAVTIGALHLRHPSVSQMLLDEVYYEMFEQWLLQPLDATNETGNDREREGEREREREAQCSMALWQILNQYEEDLKQQSSQVATLTKELSLVLQEQYSDPPACLQWLLKTELFKELMLEEEEGKPGNGVGEEEHHTEHQDSQERSKTVLDKEENDHQEDISDIPSAPSAPSVSSISSISSVPLTPPVPPPTPQTPSSAPPPTPSSTSTTVDARMIHQVLGQLEHQIIPAFTHYLTVISRKIRLIPKCLCLTGRHPFYFVYGAVLSSLHALLNDPTPLPIPIERVIAHWLNEIPLPPSGKERLQFSLAPTPSFALPLIHMERPPLNRLPLVNFSYYTLVKTLSVTQIIAVVAALLLDQKVIVLSNDIAQLSVVGESLCSLLFPFRWQNPYIPLLPRSMADMVYAPMG